MKHGLLSWLTPAELDDAQRGAYDSIVGGGRSTRPRPWPLSDEQGHLQGPFNAMVHLGELGRVLQEVGAALRYHGTLSDRVREAVVLRISALRECDFEWRAHEAAARGAGIEPAQLEAIADTSGPDGFEPALLRFVDQAVRSRQLAPGSAEWAIAEFGEAGAVEMIALIGYYDFLALLMDAFQVPLPHGVAPIFAR